MVELHTHGLLILAGFGVGLVVAVTGVGGGSLMTPLLTGPFGVPPTLAVGTDLLYAGVSKGFASGMHALRGRIDWRTVLLLLAGSLPASGVAFWVLTHLLTPAVAKSVVSHALGLALLATGLSVLLRRRGDTRPRMDGTEAAAPAKAARRERPGQAPQRGVAEGVGGGAALAVAACGTTASVGAAAPVATVRPSALSTGTEPALQTGARSNGSRIVWLVLAGAVVGALTALSSVGAGALMMAVLLRVFPERAPAELVVLDIAHAVPLALFTGAAYAARGLVDPVLLAWLLAGSLPGIYLGTRIAPRLPAAMLRRILGALLFALGLKYLIG